MYRQLIQLRTGTVFSLRYCERIVDYLAPTRNFVQFFLLQLRRVHFLGFGQILGRTGARIDLLFVTHFCSFPHSIQVVPVDAADSTGPVDPVQYTEGDFLVSAR